MRYRVGSSFGPARVLVEPQVLGVILKINKSAAKVLCVNTIERSIS